MPHPKLDSVVLLKCPRILLTCFRVRMSAWEEKDREAAGRRTTATKVGVVCARFARSRNCKGACENFAGVTYDESAGMHDIYLPFINTWSAAQVGYLSTLSILWNNATFCRLFADILCVSVLILSEINCSKMQYISHMLNRRTLECTRAIWERSYYEFELRSTLPRGW